MSCDPTRPERETCEEIPYVSLEIPIVHKVSFYLLRANQNFCNMQSFRIFPEYIC